jgi:hypothetical protein
MHHVFFLARIYPYWAIPLAAVFGQVGLYNRRRNFRMQYSFWSMAAILVLTSIAWIGFRGDYNADQWVRFVQNAFQ